MTSGDEIKEKKEKPKNFDELTAGIRKLIDICLCPTKSLKFKLQFDSNRANSGAGRKRKDSFEDKLEKKGLDVYINETMANKTYLHVKARAYLRRRLGSKGLMNENIRKKVNS